MLLNIYILKIVWPKIKITNLAYMVILQNGIRKDKTKKKNLPTSSENLLNHASKNILYTKKKQHYIQLYAKNAFGNLKIMSEHWDKG